MLGSVGEYDNMSMFIMICLACSKFVTGCVMLFLDKLVCRYKLAVFLFGYECHLGLVQGFNVYLEFCHMGSHSGLNY